MSGVELPTERMDTVTAVVSVGAGGGALSYGLSYLTDFDLITELAAGSPELVGGAFALAGGAALAADFGLLELGD